VVQYKLTIGSRIQILQSYGEQSISEFTISIIKSCAETQIVTAELCVCDSKSSRAKADALFIDPRSSGRVSVCLEAFAQEDALKARIFMDG
jgi:hypothetical protein